MKSLDQHLEEINNMRKELASIEAEVDKLREQCKQKPGFKYPIYMQSKHNKEVVKFTSLTTGVVVVASKFSSDRSVGYRASDWVEHTNTATWQPIAFDEQLGIADKQLCECWDNGYTSGRALRFYSAKNKFAYTVEGKKAWVHYDNYLPIPYADYPDWAIEAEKTLED
jgi:hypothetical protein